MAESDGFPDGISHRTTEGIPGWCLQPHSDERSWIGTAETQKRMENYRDNNPNDDIFYNENTNSLLKARTDHDARELEKDGYRRIYSSNKLIKERQNKRFDNVAIDKYGYEYTGPMDNDSIKKNGVIYGTMKWSDEEKIQKDKVSMDKVKKRLKDDFGVDVDDKFVFDHELIDDLSRVYDFIKDLATTGVEGTVAKAAFMRWVTSNRALGLELTSEEAERLYNSTIVFNPKAPNFELTYDTWVKGVGNVAKRFRSYMEKLKSKPAPGVNNPLNVSEKEFVKEMQIAHAPAQQPLLIDPPKRSILNVDDTTKVLTCIKSQRNDGGLLIR